MINKKYSLLISLLTMGSGALFAQQNQKDVLSRFDAQLSKDSIGKYIKTFSAKPHHLGSAQGKWIAEELNRLFKQYGWESKIETYQVLFPTPIERHLELIAPTTFTASLKEPALAEDATSGQDGQLPTYNAWGADGDVTGALVFVNYGLPADYEQLEKLGIDVKGKIVIAKYGKSWRGIKPKVAYEHGAIGCIIYSDPADDGYVQGDEYPKGAFKTPQTVQRGSVMDMVVYPGDPLTPGYASNKNSKRLNRQDAETILKIPVLPIGYGDAEPLLKALEGPVAPSAWRGALPFTYHVGGGNSAKVHLKIKHDWKTVPAYNVIAKLKGSTYPDEWVIRGNHHDAWVNGASDPVSGLSSLLEEARSIGLLAKQGYRPKRTLVYCAWDGEEPSLLGSTEWVEDHADELSKKAVAYINSDNNSSGFLRAGGSHALTNFVTKISKEVNDPQTGTSVFDRKKANDAINAATPQKGESILKNEEYALGALGTGSDYSAFLQHLGIPSVNYAFSGEGEGGEYHSIYDSYDNYIRFKDPDFSYGVALSEVAGHTVLELADADQLPFEFEGLYKAIKSYVDELKTQTETLTKNQSYQQKLISGGFYKTAAGNKDRVVAPKVAKAIPQIDYTQLDLAIAQLEKAAKDLAARKSAFSGNSKALAAQNIKLYRAEQALLLNGGLPRRPWYKHSIYAPGFYTGYGVKTIPGVREALEEGHYDELSTELTRVTASVNDLNETLNSIYK